MTLIAVPGWLESILPMIFVGFAGFLILAIGMKVDSGKAFSSITFVALALSLVSVVWQSYDPVAGSLVTFNPFNAYFAAILIISSLFVTFPALRNLTERRDIFYSLLLFVTLGMLVASFTMNLVVMFVAFEAVSIGTYVMAGFHKTRRALEASAKYFFTGAVSTGFIVIGLSYYFQATGTFDLTAVTIVSRIPLLTALAFLIIGFGFKLAIFPMHQWAIDTYDGSENSVSALLSTGSKILAFMIMLKLFVVGFPLLGQSVFIFFTILAILTMTYGNISALSETRLKRLLAYSSVAQAGYMILVFSAVAYAQYNGMSAGYIQFIVAAGMLYSLIYIFMKGGAFLALNSIGKENPGLEDISGMGTRSPALALSFTVLLLALAGIPLTGGFTAKAWLFLSLINVKLWWLAVIAILNSAISVFYYFRVISYMYRKEPLSGVIISTEKSVIVPVALAAAIVVALGIYFYVIYFILPFVGFLVGG
ncbi:MAG: NADH-quinone oxidoreductase subunit NuoN [Candidatus Thermoplasmatota archaeon]|jgi:NADH-quinone oxidoreductase subunit N|nr:NADH-quinone oxidoreductase subunit NuoN [Candidatus Thermoplasmatota archaeon]MCL5786182.1 NADH-quinone oxidoreductase subunit NuoN [Candidatus Thermoplasmatota archaeon]